MQFQLSRARQRIGLLTALAVLLSCLSTGVASAYGGTHGTSRTLAHSQQRDREQVRGYYLRIAGLSSPRLSGLEKPSRSAQAELDAFAGSVTDGRAGVLRGVYVAGVLALRVVHQSASAPYYVDLRPGNVTQYSAASAYGVTGLLADNIAAGALFYSLSPGQEVSLVYGDGSIRRYVVNAVYRYQALSPTSPYSDFLDLGSGARLSATDLFSQMYSGGDKVTFQTCIAQDGVLSWGRLFVTATPAG